MKTLTIIGLLVSLLLVISATGCAGLGGADNDAKTIETDEQAQKITEDLNDTPAGVITSEDEANATILSENDTTIAANATLIDENITVNDNATVDENVTANDNATIDENVTLGNDVIVDLNATSDLNATE